MPHLIKLILALFALAIAWHWDVLNRPLGPLPETIIQPPPLIAEAVLDAAHANRLDASLLARLIRQESGFRAKVCSAAGACGLTQLMPRTAKDLGVTDRTDPRQSVHGGARYLRQMLDRYQGDLDLALKAYNCGPKCVDDWRAGKRELPDETKAYASAVLR